MSADHEPNWDTYAKVCSELRDVILGAKVNWIAQDVMEFITNPGNRAKMLQLLSESEPTTDAP